MNPDFQQAIEMTRSGDKVGAQKKIAELLKADPDNAHAWYLLSLLVDSDQKRAVYLSKVVALNPNHEKAVEQLALIGQVTTTDIPISSGNDDDLIDQEKADTIPDWMADAGAPTMQTEASMLSDAEIAVEEDVPDWVQEDVSASWIEEENSVVSQQQTAVVEQKQTPPPQKKAPAKKKANKAAAKRKKQAQQLNLALGGLIILGVLVALMLIYVLAS